MCQDIGLINLFCKKFSFSQASNDCQELKRLRISPIKSNFEKNYNNKKQEIKDLERKKRKEKWTCISVGQNMGLD